MTVKPIQGLKIPKIGKQQLSLLEKLSNAHAVSGDEHEVRNIVKQEITAAAARIKTDAMGNLLVTRPSTSPQALKVMVAAHMDEIGLMITKNENGGFYRFAAVGGIDPRQLPGKRVCIGKDHWPGVIGIKPIHLQKRKERESVPEIEDLFIDAGDADKINPGERVSFATSFQPMGKSLMGKALDNRLGVMILMELIKNAPSTIELQAAFTVQEEIGLRGAKVAAHYFNPDLALVIDSTPAMDLPVWDHTENATYNTQLGKGAALYLADSGTVSDPRLVAHLEKTAHAYHIPYQFRQPGGGKTDAASIHLTHSGIPSVTISVPGRYAHTAAMICRLQDIQSVFGLIFSALHTMPIDILKVAR